MIRRIVSDENGLTSVDMLGWFWIHWVVNAGESGGVP